ISTDSAQRVAVGGIRRPLRTAAAVGSGVVDLRDGGPSAACVDHRRSPGGERPDQVGIDEVLAITSPAAVAVGRVALDGPGGAPDGCPATDAGDQVGRVGDGLAVGYECCDVAEDLVEETGSGGP